MINTDNIKNLPETEEILKLIQTLKYLLVKYQCYAEAAEVRDIEKKIIAQMELNKEKAMVFEFAAFLTLCYHTSHHMKDGKPDITYFENGTNSVHTPHEVYSYFKEYQKKSKPPVENYFGAWEPMPGIDISIIQEYLKKTLLYSSGIKDGQTTTEKAAGT